MIAADRLPELPIPEDYSGVFGNEDAGPSGSVSEAFEAVRLFKATAMRSEQRYLKAEAKQSPLAVMGMSANGELLVERAKLAVATVKRAQERCGFTTLTEWDAMNPQPSVEDGTTS